MTAATIAAVAWAVLAAFRGVQWHGRRMYARGVARGRELEALDAAHAREQVVRDAKLLARVGALHVIRDRQLIARWVTQAFRR